MLTATITFGANAQGVPVLAAMTALGEQLATDARWSVKNPRIHPQVVAGPWKHLVFGHPARDDGTVDRGAYIFCVLEQFCRHLKHREIYAETSTRYRNPQARLLDGAEWEAVKDDVLTTLGLPEDPGALLASHVTALDEALKYVAGRLAANADVRVDEAGRIHVTGDKAIAEPPSLVDLRKRVAAMLPRVGIGEQILEVMGWVPQFLESLTALSGGAARMAGLNVTIAACLTGQALNIGYGPDSTQGVPALERHRIGHVGRTYLRAAGYTAANPHLIAQQVGIGFAQALGGGMVAAIDGMRFVVPVPSLMAKPNRKYFGPKRGMTFLNMINDQAFGTGHKIVAGTDRDCIHAIDLFFSPGAANLPEVLVTDTGSYSDLVFGIASLLGVDYRPALADLPDQKGWRTKADGCGSCEVSWLSCEDEAFAVKRAVDAFVLAAEVEAPVGVEVAGGDDGAQFQDGLGSFEPPSRACDVHSVLDDVPAGALDDPGGDGPALPERGGVVQVVLLVVQVAGALVGAGPLGGRVPVGGGAAADPGRDLGGFAVQDLAGLGGDPFLGRGLALVEK